MTTDTTQPRRDFPLTVTDTGDGRPVLVLHGGGGPTTVTAIVDRFAVDSRVLAPIHPGWEGTKRPDWFSGMDDLAITYLDLLEDHDLRDVLVLGSSFGGWVAAEMAVRDRGHHIGQLVLLGADGPETPGHEALMPGRRPADQTSAPRVGPPADRRNARHQLA